MKPEPSSECRHGTRIEALNSGFRNIQQPTFDIEQPIKVRCAGRRLLDDGWWVFDVPSTRLLGRSVSHSDLLAVHERSVGSPSPPPHVEERVGERRSSVTGGASPLSDSFHQPARNRCRVGAMRRIEPQARHDTVQGFTARTSVSANSLPTRVSRGERDQVGAESPLNESAGRQRQTHLERANDQCDRRVLSGSLPVRGFVLAVCLGLGLTFSLEANEDIAGRSFDQGVAAAKAGDSTQAFELFGESAAAVPSSGALYNLGNAAWRIGRPGPAILAWEQALWLDPHNKNARSNLRYARHTGDLEEPDLRWFEVCSSWLPANWWPVIAAASFWACLSLLILPSVFRRRRRDWFQASAAACAAVFLLCLPALAGLSSRARLGFILPKEAGLRVTPTAEAQILTYLPSGEPARWERTRGDYALIRTRRSTGWVKQDELGLIGGGKREQRSGVMKAVNAASDHSTPGSR